MSFFHVTINKLSSPPVKIFPNCFWQYVTKIKKGSPEKNLEFLRLFENIIQVDYFNLEFGRKS